MRVFGLLALILSLPLMAWTELTTQIHDIDYGDYPSDEILVLLKTGLVAKVRKSNPLILNDFMKVVSRHKWYMVRIDKNRYIETIKETIGPIKKTGHTVNFFETLQDYVPTTVANIDLAKKYHRKARYNPKESQCFNRAMVWTYEWWKKHSLKSNKLLIFFTRTYIRKYNFEWWFHIAPYVHVMDNGKVVERVLDVKYTNGPRDFQNWANIFLRNDAPCPMITKFSEYADHPYTGSCYFQRTHMYTYQPADLQMYEAWNYQKTNFNMDEVRGAYLEAFDENI